MQKKRRGMPPGGWPSMQKKRGMPKKQIVLDESNIHSVLEQMNTYAPGNYVASLKLLEGGEYSGSGGTIYEAVQKIPFDIKPGLKAVLTARSGEKKAEMLLFALPLRRFVMNKVNRDIQAKRLLISMK